MHKILAFILLINSIASYSQKSSIVIENIDQDASLMSFNDETSIFLKQTRGGALRSEWAKPLGYSVLFYNNYSNSLANNQELLSDKLSHNFDIIKTIDKEDNINIYFSDFNRKSKEIEISSINISKGKKVVEEPKRIVGFPIDNVPFLVVVGQPRRFYTEELIVGPKLANDGETVFGTVLYGKSSSKAKVFTIREDETTEIEIQLPTSSELFEIIEQQCDDSGNVYILGYVKTSKKAEVHSIDRRKVYLLKVDFKTKKVRKMLINSGKLVKTLTMILSKDGQIFIMGVGHTNQVVNSYMSFLYNSNLQLQKRNVGAIEEGSFLNSFTTKAKSVLKGAKENEYYYSCKSPIIIEHENGSFSTFIEQFYNIEKTISGTNSNGVVTHTTIYEEYTVGITGLSFNSLGAIQGSQRLNTGNSSRVLWPNDCTVKDFGAYSYRGKAAIIFQYSTTNELDGMKMNSFSKGTQLLRATLNEDGSFKEEVVYELPENLTSFNAQVSNLIATEDHVIALSGKNVDPDRKNKGNFNLVRDGDVNEGGTFVMLIE